MPEANDDDDPDTLAAFGRLLDKLGPEAFKKWLKENSPSSPTQAPSPTPANDLTTFLQTSLDKAEKAQAKLTEQLEELRDLLTPEQLTLLKSRKSAPKSGDDPKGPPTNQKDPPDPDPKAKPPATKKRSWL